MIFVAVGTQKFQFDRLLKAVDELVERNIIQEPVIAQIGNSDYQPKNFAFEKFFHQEAFEKKVRDCDVLITHSGVATIIAGLKQGKKVIVVPRLKKYAEHVDDHQVQIAQSFSEQNLVLMCGEADDLGQLIEKAKQHSFSGYVSQRSLVLQTIRDYLNGLESGRKNH